MRAGQDFTATPPVFAAPVIGRDREMAEIAALVDRLDNGTGGALLLEGPAGIGKTRLVETGFELAATRGIAVAHVAADASGSRRPFHLALAIAGALPHRNETSPGEELRDLLQSVRPAPDATTAAAPGAARVHVIEAIVAELEQRAQSPLVMTVDDLHLADEASLATLRALLPLTAETPLLVIGTRQPARSGIAGRHLRHDFARWGRVVELTPLDDGATTELATRLLGAPPTAELEAVLTEVAGSPLWITELIRSLRAEGRLHEREGLVSVEPGVRPHAFHDLVDVRLDPLPSEVTSVLRRTAVLGTATTIEELAALAGRTPADILDPVDDALRSELLVDDGGRLDFAHDLVRDAVYRRIPPGIRRTLHREAARLLAERRAPSVLVARHVALSASPDDAAKWLTLAAEDAMTLAPESALEMLDEARALTGTGPAVGKAIQRARIDALLGLGRLDEAIRLADQMCETTPPGDERADLLTRVGGMLVVANRASEACGRLEQAVAESSRSSVRALATAQHALARIALADIANAESLARNAASLGAAVGQPAAQVLAESVLARIPCFTHHYRSGLPHAHRAVEIASSDRSGTGHDYLPWFWLGVVALDLDDHQTVERAIREGRVQAARLHAAWAEPLYAGLAASLHHRRGALDQAAAEAETGASLSAETGSTPALLWCQSIAALVAGRRGESTAQKRWTDAAESTWSREGALLGADHFIVATSELLAAAEATARLTEAWEIFSNMGMHNCTPMLAVPLARAAGGAAREQSSRVAAALTHAAATTGVPGLAAIARHARGILDADVDALVDAADRFDELGRRLDRAEALADAARVAFRRHDPRANELHALATTVFEHCDANPTACLSQPHREVLPPAPSREGWAALTETEQAVVALVGRGLTNSEIAEIRHVSRRTIESHLVRVYAKLGISGRSRLAVAARDRQAAPAD